jgi:hypothetical protein
MLAEELDSRRLGERLQPIDLLARHAERLARRRDRRLVADVLGSWIVQDDDDAVFARELVGEAGLPDAGRPRQRDEPRAVEEEAPQVRELALAPEERRVSRGDGGGPRTSSARRARSRR